MSAPATIYPTKNNGNRRITEPTPVRWLLTGVALIFLGLFLFVPLAAVFSQALEKGWETYLAALREPDALAAIRLTFLTAPNRRTTFTNCACIMFTRAKWMR